MANGYHDFMRPETGSAEIFLSYTQATSAAAAQRLYQALVANGLRVFKDSESIRASDRWLEKLDAALAGCCVFIVLVEPTGLERWTLAETLVALNRNVNSDLRSVKVVLDSTHASATTEAPVQPRPRLLPVLMNGTSAEVLPGLLRQHQAMGWQANDAPDPPHELIEAVKHVLADLVSLPPLPPDGRPFKGLLPFEQSDELWFFGRHADTLAALALLGNPDQHPPESPATATQQRRWLCITGASGSGKSSLLRAALVPLLRQGALWARTGVPRWRVADPLLPGREPLLELALALERAWVDDPQQRNSVELLRRLRSGPAALLTWLRERQNEARPCATVICVDQAEELFTQCTAQQREQFDRLLAEALAEPRCRLYLVMTIRGDHQHQIDSLPALAPLQNSLGGAYRLNPLDPARLRMTIEGPARLAGLDVRELALVMVEDARDDPLGALPLVQHALAQLYQQRRGAELSLDLYRSLGGLAGMLREQADGTLNALRQHSAAHERGALALLRALCHYGPEGRHTRRHLKREAAVRQAGLGQIQRGEQVLQVLESARLVVGDGAPDQHQRVDLVHETLLRRRDDGEPVWLRLHAHLEDTREADWDRERLERLGQQWAQASWWQRPGLALGITQLADSLLLWRLRHLADQSALRFLEGSFNRQSVQAGIASLTVVAMLHGLHWAGTVNGHPLGYAWRPTAWILGLAEPWPDVVNIPLPETGRFWMGCKPGRDDVNGITCVDDEAPSEVPLTQPYALGRTEVSYMEYHFYVWNQHRAGVWNVWTDLGIPIELGYPPANYGRGDHPIIGLTVYEVRAYLQWLTTQRARADQAFRLPSEAEWEYAARAETPSDPRSRPGPFWWGQSLPSTSPGSDENREAVVANCGVRCGVESNDTLPVRTLPANPFGLYHMNGNTFEWTDSPYDLNEKPHELVQRGGSWISSPKGLRASVRERGHPMERKIDVGFRVCLSASNRIAGAAAH